MNTVNRKPLLVMIPLIAAFAAFAVPAFAQQTQQSVQEDAAVQEPQTQSDAASAATSGTAEQAQQSGASSGQQGWNDLDTDKDGAISKQEASANPGLAQVFGQADGNADGKLTLAEYKAFVVKNYGG